MRRGVAVAVVGLVLGLAAPACACTLVWRSAPGPHVQRAMLRAVTARTPADAWAVGGPTSIDRGAPKPGAVVEHWDGSRWRLVPSPHVAAVLESVAAVGLRDVWAVGERSDPSGTPSTLKPLGAVAEHFDGTRWRLMPMPGLGRLTGVAATSGGDVWAVGANAGGVSVVIHRRGSHWQTVLRRPRVQLRSIAALTSGDVWVSGIGRRGLLELHWNGQRWTAYAQSLHSNLGGSGMVYAAGPNDVWAAGNAPDPGSPAWPLTLLFHWDGAAWHRERAPAFLWVNALALDPAGALQIAGYRANGDAAGAAAVDARTATGWTENELAHGAAIQALGADGADGLWGVGYVGSFANGLGFPTHAATVIERGRCG